MYALQHKETGVFMPDKKGGAGGTYVEPFEKRRRQTTTPRLFPRRCDALAALRWWAEGKVETQYDEEWGPQIVGQRPVEGRNAADWETVEVKVLVVKDAR